MVRVAVCRDRRGRAFFRVLCRLHGWVSPAWYGKGRDVITPALLAHELEHARG